MEFNVFVSPLWITVLSNWNVIRHVISKPDLLCFSNCTTGFDIFVPVGSAVYFPGRFKTQ